jgi:ELWxxDGT repeat protein
MVKNINPAGSSNPQSLTDINGLLFFSANDGTNGSELWKSNGTEAGTVMVKNINPTGHSSPLYLVDFNGSLFFAAEDGSNGSELWKSDGTSAGTVLVKDICPGSSHSTPQHLTVVNGSLFFSANNCTDGYELWMYVNLTNDDCEGAIPVSSGSVYTGSNYGAAGTDLTSCAYDDFADTWYYFQPSVSGEYTLNASSGDFDTTLAVFNACGGNELDCNDDFLTTDSQVVLYMVAGKRYYIRVAGFDDQMGNFQLSVDAGSCTQLAQSDLNGDCIVDFLDFAIMTSEWLTCNLSPPDLCP